MYKHFLHFIYIIMSWKSTGRWIQKLFFLCSIDGIHVDFTETVIKLIFKVSYETCWLEFQISSSKKTFRYVQHGGNYEKSIKTWIFPSKDWIYLFAQRWVAHEIVHFITAVCYLYNLLQYGTQNRNGYSANTYHRRFSLFESRL